MDNRARLTIYLRDHIKVYVALHDMLQKNEKLDGTLIKSLSERTGVPKKSVCRMVSTIIKNLT